MATMSSYYTQNTTSGQPGSMHFSTWSHGDNATIETLNETQQPQGSPMFPPEGTQYNNSSSINPSDGSGNAERRFMRPNLPEPPVQTVDPNATRLSREHFRTARDNAIANTSGSNSNSDSDTQQPWWIVILIGFVVFLILGGCLYVSQSSKSVAFGSGNVGGGGLSNGLSGGLESMSGLANDCRVDMPRITTPDAKGGECAIDPGKIGDLGSSKIVTPYGVTYYRPGVTVREFNGPELRLPQKREFLGPEFYNSGCATLYGNNRFNQGPNSAMTDYAATMAMFDYTFAPRPYFEGNAASCYNAGVKCMGPNSALGWMTDKSGTPMWQVADNAVLNAVCQNQSQ